MTPEELENDVWAQAHIAALRTELTPGRLRALIAGLAEHGELQMLAYGHAEVERHIGAPLTEDEWRQVRETTSWKRIMDVADDAVFNARVINKALKEAQIDL